jgi:hypothetical protein
MWSSFIQQNDPEVVLFFVIIFKRNLDMNTIRTEVMYLNPMQIMSGIQWKE